jgi:hypothetical protein
MYAAAENNSGYDGADVVSAVEETCNYPTIHLMVV